MAAQLPPPRLVVTKHTPDGKSVFASDSQIAPFFPFGPQASSFARFHSRISVPASNATSPPDQYLADKPPRCPPNGVFFGTSDFQPGGAAPMHRTQSLDYAAVISGEIVLRLDSGEERTVRAGEFIVQRGVNHEWINRGSEVCRVMFVMVGAEKVVLGDGTVLEETVFKK